MAIVQAILALLLQHLGRFLHTAFGWATSLLFGRVPRQRQYYVTAIAFVSLLWLLAAIGIAMPGVGAYLLAFAHIPKWVNPNWVRLGMLGSAVLLPAVVGVLALLLIEPQDRPKRAGGIARAIFKGYPYTLGLALTMLMMIIVAPLMKLRDLIKGWSSRHIPIVVDAPDYFHIVGQIQEALAARDMPTERRKASPLLRWPTRLFTLLAGSGADELVAKELMMLIGSDLEILLHPSDLVIRGREKAVSKAYGVIGEQLAFTKAHFTWSKEAREIEDRLGLLWAEIERGEPLEAQGEVNRLDGLKQQLQTAGVSSEEWDVLFREILLIECSLLRRMAHQPQHLPTVPG